MIKINVVLNNEKWNKYLKNPKAYLKKKLIILNRKLNKYQDKKIYFTVLLSEDYEIKSLNKKFRKKNKSTDILSFPFFNRMELKKRLTKEKEIYLGDIIINLNKIKDKKSIRIFKEKFDRLWIHGLVHLLGYDHKKDKDFYKMSIIEKKFLSYIN